MNTTDVGRCKFGITSISRNFLDIPGAAFLKVPRKILGKLLILLLLLLLLLHSLLLLR